MKHFFSLQAFATESLVGIASGHSVKCCQTFSQVRRKEFHPMTNNNVAIQLIREQNKSTNCYTFNFSELVE